MMQRRHEKIIYENDRGERVEVAYSFPFFLQQILGVDGTSAEISTTKGVGQDGVTINNVSLQPRPIQIIGTIRGKSKEELQTYRAKLLKVFNPKVQGWLQYEYGNVKRQIRVQVDSSPVFSKVFNTFEVLNFIIDLIAPNPYFMDENTISEEVAQWIGGMKFPLRLPTRFATKGEPRILIINKGDAEAPVEFVIVGPVINPMIRNSKTGEYIKVNRTLNAGERMYITTGFGNKRVFIKDNEGNETNVFNWIEIGSVFINLEVGDNPLEYTSDDVDFKSRLFIKYRNMYNGV